MEHCRENLAPYKVPKVIEITEAIPLTAVGKVDKKALRVKMPAQSNSVVPRRFRNVFQRDA
jgi:non-ribosomal peptide synthetase component E (peptide arylation enzyme)